MSIRLVALDLDDTLLNTTNTVSPRCREAIRKAVAKGVTVTVSTGRMYCSALPYARQLELDVPIITYNGALIKSCLSGEVLYQHTLDPQVVAEIYSLFRERGWYIQSYIGDTLYVKERDEKARYYEKLAGITAEAVGDDLYSMTDGVLKMLTIDEPEEIKKNAKLVQELFAGKVFAPISRPNYMEIVDSQVNKGRALSFLAEKLGITRSEIMAVGDSNNDLDMIRFAGLGVAMGNALEHVKQIADAVTLSNDEDGVAEAIHKYVLSE